MAKDVVVVAVGSDPGFPSAIPSGMDLARLVGLSLATAKTR